jgi:hypothetical protein
MRKVVLEINFIKIKKIDLLEIDSMIWTPNFGGQLATRKQPGPAAQHCGNIRRANDDDMIQTP